MDTLSTCRTKSFQCIQVQKNIGRVAELHYLQVVETKVILMFCRAERSSLEKAPMICCWDLFYQVRHHTLLSCKSILARVTLICHQVYFVKYGIILKLLILKQLKSSSCNTTSQFWKNMMLSYTFSLIQNKQNSCFLMRFGISHQLLTLIYVTHEYMLSPKCCICLQNYEINITQLLPQKHCFFVKDAILHSKHSGFPEYL